VQSMSFSRVLRFGLPVGLLGATIFAPAANAVPVTFAQFIQEDGAAQNWQISTSGTSTVVTVSGAVYISFSGVPGLPFSGPQSAEFTLTATSNSLGACGVACGAGDSLTQAGYAGTFSFIDTGSLPGTNLLSGTFSVTGSPSTTGAQFSSHVGSSGASFDASATGGNLDQLVLTSAYVQFLNTTDEDASFSLSSLIPNFATGTVTNDEAYPAEGNFAAAGTGTFSSNPGPVAAPEPPTLAVLASGLMGLGLMTRGKRSKAGRR
jgi:hypothetical protein